MQREHLSKVWLRPHDEEGYVPSYSSSDDDMSSVADGVNEKIHDAFAVDCSGLWVT